MYLAFTLLLTFAFIFMSRGSVPLGTHKLYVFKSAKGFRENVSSFDLIFVLSRLCDPMPDGRHLSCIFCYIFCNLFSLL